MAAAKLRSAELHRPHKALMPLEMVVGCILHIQNTLRTYTQQLVQQKGILQVRN